MVAPAGSVAAAATGAADTTVLAPAAAVFACVTAPLSPGLFTRTETLIAAGAACCVAAATAASTGDVGCAETALVEPLPAAFACVTAPSVPGLAIRTETLMFAGDACATTAVTASATALTSGAVGVTAGGSTAGGRSSAYAARAGPNNEMPSVTATATFVHRGCEPQTRGMIVA